MLLSECEFDALASWVFSVGVNWADESVLMRELRAGRWDVIPVELMLYHGLGAIEIGRRRREAYLWLRGHDGVPAK